MDGAAPSALLAWIQVFTPLGLIALSGWVVWRTRSRHLLVRRLWQLMHGSQQIADPQIKAYVEDEGADAAIQLARRGIDPRLDDPQLLLNFGTDTAAST